MSDEIHSYIQLQQQIHHALRVQHPDWVEFGPLGMRRGPG